MGYPQRINELCETPPKKRWRVPSLDEIKKTLDVSLEVRKIIAESLFVDLEKVQTHSFLIKDLAAESIDFLEIMFKLEKTFNIKIPQREIEKQARGDMPPEDFEIEGILQPKGLARLQELLPEVDPQLWREGMALRELPSLFTVAVFIGIVQRKLDGTLFDSRQINAA